MVLSWIYERDFTENLNVTHSQHSPSNKVPWLVDYNKSFTGKHTLFAFKVKGSISIGT